LGLTNEQIERYARQIIVPGISGMAQERLLASHLVLVGDARDLVPVFPYLAGAGIGHIQLLLPARDQTEKEWFATRAADLNPDVVVSTVPSPPPFDMAQVKKANAKPGQSDLILAIEGGPEAAELLHSLSRIDVPLILVRLTDPASIAIFTTRPPCPICADDDLMAKPFGEVRGDNAGFVAMIAATEAFKLLARFTPAPPSRLLQFKNFACTTKPLRQRTPPVKCACSA